MRHTSKNIYTGLATAIWLGLISFTPVLFGQEVVAGSSAPAAGAGIDWGRYTVSSSVESGYRFTTVGGNADLFRSVENYGNGLRVFGGTFAAISQKAGSGLFDSLTFDASGLGNDPYGTAILRVHRANLYRYNMTWRRDDYYNSAILNGASDTLKQTRRILQDHDLTITPSKHAKLLLGYTRNHETGTEFTDYETYIGGLTRSLLPLDRNVRRDYNEYRVGSEIEFLGFQLLLSHRWEYYKDDSSIASVAPGQPNPADFLLNQPYNPTLEVTYPQAALYYLRSQPMHTRYGSWLGNLNRNEKYWAMNARMTYTQGNSTTLYYENQTGASAVSAPVPSGDGRVLTSTNSGFGPTINAYTYMPGSARRPFTAGDFTFTLFPQDKITVINSVSVDSNRYDGTGNEYRQLSNGAAVINRFWTFHIGTGRVSAATDVNYRVKKWLGFHAEYRYTSRFIDNNLTRTGTTNSRDLNSIRDHLNLATVGFRVRPWQPLSISGDATMGHDNSPENPTSPAKFHNIRGRMDYKSKRLHVGLNYRMVYNLNDPLSVYSASTGQLVVGQQLDYYASHSRDLSATSSFEATRHIGFDVSYTKAHLDTLANLWAELVPATSTTVTSVSVRGYTSEYISNLHTVSANTRASIGRFTLYAGYNLSRDTGDGRNVQNLGLTDLAAADTASWSTFPMSYQAPLARISARITPHLQWNAGWQFYKYSQKFSYFGNQPYYHAHAGFASLTYTLGSGTRQ